MGRLPLAAASLLCALIVAEAMLRPRTGSPDAYQYLDVAANLAEGHGLVQSVPGYNSPRFPAEVRWPQPFTSGPPLYPWLASLAIRARMEPVAALTSVAAVAAVLAWVAGAWLAAGLWGEQAGVLALAGLALSSLSPTLTCRVWSDPLAIALGMLTLAALARERTVAAGSPWWAAAAGAGAGLAFLARYIFLLLLPFGIAWLLLAKPATRRLRAILAFGAGAVAFVVPLLGRNQALAGGWFGERRNASDQDLAGIVSNAFRMTWGRLPTALQWLFLAGAVAAGTALFVSRDRRERTRAALAAGAGLVPLWLGAYTLAVVLVRLRVHFDNVGFRLLTPALAGGWLLVSGLAARLVAWPRTALNLAVSLALLAGAARVGLRIRDTPDPARLAGGRSGFIRWLTAEIPPGAIVIAEDGEDLAWALRNEPGAARRIVSFSPAPYMRPLTHEDLARFAARWYRPDGPPLRVLVRGGAADDAAWRERYGGLIADAVAGRVPVADGLVLERVVDGRHVLRWRAAGSDGEGGSPGAGAGPRGSRGPPDAPGRRAD